MNFALNFVIHIIGLALALNALFQSRTPQGALAWFLALVGFPKIGIPLFIIFGRRRYHEERPSPVFKIPRPEIVLHQNEVLEEFEKFLKHTGAGFTGNNTIDLLINGEMIYEKMCEDISNAKKYIILQVYIFRTDNTGKRFIELLSRKAKEGVKVYVLYEKVLIKMSKKSLKYMRESGVHLGLFRPGTRNKLQLNFRNHRKILIVDGEVGFFGGINIGDDYIGKDPNIGAWRDTNVRVRGPALIEAQKTFCYDWFSSQGSGPDIDWQSSLTEGNDNILIFSSGPVQEKPFCLLHHIAMVDMAVKRLWIANPYIVPPQSLLDALFMAALRGVDVRLIVPSYSDNQLVMLAANTYYERLISYGIKIFKYKAGFLHQKVMLVDDILGVVGSANFDYRSMYINFEVTLTTSSQKFIKDLELMLIDDFKNSDRLNLGELRNKVLYEKILERGMNLLVPVL
ncbi:MAG: cardiolipin synthase [Bacteriovoracaceae bacterium]